MPLGSFEPLPFCHGCAATLSPFTGKVDANAMSRRKGCIGAALVFVNPSVKPSACQLPVKGSLLGMVLTQTTSLP